MSDLITAITKPGAVLLPKQHIFLLSHMRAYTSLFGHIMGSNPAICGYYEMHIGYHSWKSLMRQKLRYFSEEDAKPSMRFMFDKVLHNDHNVSPTLLNLQRCHAIFSLRSPEQVIPSILKLYAKVDPQHEYNSEAFSTHYYIGRLAQLQRLSQQMTQPYFYMDAAALKGDSANCLASLSDWLGLTEPLSEHYEMQKNTSKQRYGDSSDRMRAGSITKDVSDFGSFTPDAQLMNAAMEAYETTRSALVLGCAAHSLAETFQDQALS